MEPPVSSSRGPMSSLLRKLDSILECQQLLRNPLREDFELLKEDLAGTDTFLLEISDEDDPNLVKKYWMKEVREICYDAEDFIDWLIHSAEAKIGSVGVVPRLKISQLPSRTRPPRPRLKISRLPRTLNPDPRPNIASQINELRARLEDAGERHKRYVLDNNTAYSSVHSHSHWIPEWYREAVSILVGIDDSKKKLINLLNNGEKKLNVISISGLGGIGKTTLAKQILQELGWQFGCHAFVRVSRKPDIRSLLRGILSQTGWRHHSEACNLQQLIDHLSEHLRHRRFLIVIDDLWDTAVWDFLLRAFPDGTQSSRIITTTTSENVATTCCGNRSDYILRMEPLNDDDSRKIFFARVFGSENKCPQQFKDASYEIVRKCGGVPLAVIHIAGLLTRQQDKSEEWDYVERSLGSNLSTTPTYEGMRKVINLSYNGLPQCLKTCLQYVCMYPENCTIWKDDLVRRWVAEGFIEGDSEVIAQSHFEELVYRGMIHPTDIDYNEQVLSCTVHHMILDFVRNKSAEDNFVTTVDYSQNTRELSSKVRRLLLFYSTAKYAAKLLGITLLQVRSLAFYGLVKCLPSIQEFKFLRVLVLHLWGDYNDSTIVNLSGINKLFQLRYLKVTCNYCLQLPTNMGGLHHLETLEINAIVTSVPEDIIHLKYLVHLSLPLEAKLPYEMGRLRSLRTLKCFDFCGNLDDEVKSLQELSCLEELQLVLTTAPSDSVDRNLKVLFSILGCLYKLKSLVIVRGAPVSKDSITIIDSSSTSCPKDCLERLELHRGPCILRSLPKWIGQLGSLCILKLGVLEILKNDVDSFAGLQVLKFLSLYVRRPTAEPIIISSGAFPALECFKFKSGVLCIAFSPGAMPKLHRLKLSFNAYSGVEFGSNMIVGIEHLLNLQEVSGRIGAAVGSKESEKRTAESKLKNAISKHSMIPRLNIQVVDWIEEDRLPAGDIMPSKMQINKLFGDHGFLGGKSEVNTIKVDECRTSSLFPDAVVTSSDVLNSDYKRKKSYVDISKGTGRRLSTTTDIMSLYSDKSFYWKVEDSSFSDLDDLANTFSNVMPEFSDPRTISSMHHGRQGHHFPLQGGRSRFRSKYMSTEELESILRMLHAPTHINDPYIDDYYHQACLASRYVDARSKHRFCPTLIRDPSSSARRPHAYLKVDALGRLPFSSIRRPHAYLKVDALGRLPFSSIRRPRPLLDIEPACARDENTLISKPLDQEPLLAARITIEDGLSLLLDIDDIDRLLQFSQQQDGGLQLKNRRQSLLGQLAESLQLVDPLGPNKNTHLSANDDLIFLRIVSLPKGRKLLSRYINLMVPGSDLARIVCMAVFRHLRFVFGNLPSDDGSAETVTKLASAVAACIRGMDLSGLSACLAAIVCSSEHPPLRPLGYAAGDGATLIIKSVLDRATELLTEQPAAPDYSAQNRALWQASFNAFFGLLTKYCVSKPDSMVHTMHKHRAAATVIHKELPIELLRASLPHTDEQQRRLLLEFAQRTMPLAGHNSDG